jgi:hypothetical protein
VAAGWRRSGNRSAGVREVPNRMCHEP